MEESIKGIKILHLRVKRIKGGKRDHTFVAKQCHEARNASPELDHLVQVRYPGGLVKSKCPFPLSFILGVRERREWKGS